MTSPDNNPDLYARSVDRGNRLREDEIQRTVEFYNATVAERTRGPQLEGIEIASLERALENDPNVIFADIHDDNGEVIKWPLLTPAEHHIDYSQRFFNGHYADRPSYFLSLPPHGNIEELLANADKFRTVAERLKQENAIVAYDYVEGLDEGQGDENAHLIPEFLQALLADAAELQDITPESKLDGIKYGLPKVAHYEGYVQASTPPENPAPNLRAAFDQLVEKGKIAEEGDNGVVYLKAKALRANNGALLDQIWEKYDDQFNTLTEDHPSLQKQPREELERMLLNEDSINIVYMEDGEVVGMLYFVHDMESCVWLNGQFYERYNDKGWLAYYPGILVAKEKARQGMGYAQAMIASLGDAVMATDQKLIVTCQCTNVSMTYVLKIVAGVVNAQPGVKMVPGEDGEAFKKVAEYQYRVAEVI